MNTRADAMSESPVESQGTAAANISEARRFYWLVRRELWESRFLYVAPLAVAGVALFGFSLSVTAGIWEAPLRLDAARPHAPFDMAAGVMMLTGIVVSVFYCLDALYGERRDRSILFWKSLPVSDAVTVLAKASIPLVIIPLLIVVVSFAMQWLMLIVSSMVVLASGGSVAMLWTKVSFLRTSFLMLYHVLTAHALWPAPFYCWLLLVSAWSRRAPILWAAVPLVAIAGVEQIAFHTWHFASLVGSRLLGAGPAVAVSSPDRFPTDPMTHIAAGSFLSSPGLWIGLLFGAACLAAAVRLRRYREPI